MIRNRRSSGFSLIELMIAVAIIAILAAIAFPSYQQHVVKTRRGAGAACLMEMAQFMERYHTTNMSYAGAVLPATNCRAEVADHYSLAFTANPTASAYSITATAQGAQASKDTKCGHLTVNQAGTKTVSVSGTSPGDCF